MGFPLQEGEVFPWLEEPNFLSLVFLVIDLMKD